MAIYHCSIKTVSRNAGRSAPASAAYRAGVSLIDERTGEIHDYTRRSGVEHTELVMPEGVILDREQLWNAAEASESRKNSTVAREYELALPEELNQEQRKALALDFARHLANRYGVAADVAIHEPGRKGDNRNHHAHILTTTRTVTPEGFGAKTRALDDKKTGEVEHVRATWAKLTNQALARSGHAAIRVSHKSLEAQGIYREPTTHLGPTATAMERRGVRSDRGDMNRSQGEGQAKREELAALERQESGMSAARSRAHEWKQEQARAAADAQRRAELERERQRQREEQERERQRQEQVQKLEAERKAREEQRQKEPRGRGRDQGMSR